MSDGGGHGGGDGGHGGGGHGGGGHHHGGPGSFVPTDNGYQRTGGRFTYVAPLRVWILVAVFVAVGIAAMVFTGHAH